MLGSAHGLLGMAQGELSFTQKSQPGLCRHHTFTAALQQARRQLAFKSADLLAQRRLHQIEVERSAAHATEFNNTNEIFKLPKFHRQPG